MFSRKMGLSPPSGHSLLHLTLAKIFMTVTDSLISPVAYWGGVRCGNDVLPAGCVQTAVWKENEEVSPCISLGECDAPLKPVGKVKRLMASLKSRLNCSQLTQFSWRHTEFLNEVLHSYCLLQCRRNRFSTHQKGNLFWWYWDVEKNPPVLFLLSAL